MLTKIDNDMLTALEAELARVTAQRDALRDAVTNLLPLWQSGIEEPWVKQASAALQACQD